MPLRILKIVAEATVTTTTNPEVTRFFHNVATETTGGTLAIPVEEFEADNGDPATTLPELTADNSYINCYINGVLQMDGIFTYTPGGTGEGQLEIIVDEDETIQADTPIVLEIVNYDPDSTVDIVT